jgi:hypothetical protein
MENLTVKEVREAIAYVCKNDGITLQDVSDENLLKLDLVKSLNIGNVRLINIAIELQRRHNFILPYEVLRERPDDTVKSFIEVINRHRN